MTDLLWPALWIAILVAALAFGEVALEWRR